MIKSINCKVNKLGSGTFQYALLGRCLRINITNTLNFSIEFPPYSKWLLTINPIIGYKSVDGIVEINKAEEGWVLPSVSDLSFVNSKIIKAVKIKKILTHLVSKSNRE